MANRYFVVHKPFGFLSQFTDPQRKSGVLGELHKFPKDVYAVGRLDKDSEGLLILTNDKSLNEKLLNPKNAHQRIYWAQVEKDISEEAMEKLRTGVPFRAEKKEFFSLPAEIRKLDESEIWFPERYPAPRIKHGSSWVELKMIEGKNRQVRRVTAAVGYPTLRLVRVAIEGIKLDGMKPGEVRELSEKTINKLLFRNNS